MTFQKGQKLGGRPKGIPNKATLAAREAISIFVDGNAWRLQEWLDRIADGTKDEDGKVITEGNPEKAFNLFQSVIEYHIPKLARSELTGKDGKDLIPTNITLELVKPNASTNT